LINARVVVRLHAQPSGSSVAHLRRRQKVTEPRGATSMAKADPQDARSRRTALVMSTLDLAACFMVWTVFSIVGVRIQREFGLNETQFGLLVGMPILTGALSRLPLGILADRIGGRLVYTDLILVSYVSISLMPVASHYTLHAYC